MQIKLLVLHYSLSSINPINAGLALRGVPLVVPPLSLKLCDPNFVQNYFGIR